VKRSLVLLWAILWPAAAIAVPPKPMPLTLAQALEIARRQNVDIALAEIAQNKFESQYWQVFASALPQATFTGNYTRNIQKPVAFLGNAKIEAGADHGINSEIRLEQTLYSGGKVHTAIRAAREERAVAGAVAQATREEVFLAVRRLFYGGLLARATVGIQRDNLDSTEKHLQTIRARFQQGLDSDLTVRRQEVEVAHARTAVIQAQNLEDMTITSLQELLSLDVDRPLELVGQLVPPKSETFSYDSFVQKALARRPELRAAREQRLVAKDLVAIAQSDYKPSLGLFASYQWVSQFRRWPPEDYERGNVLMAGAQISQSLFSGGETVQRVRQARLDYDRALQEEGRVERAARVEVKRQWLAVREALERAQAEETAVGQARLTLQATETRYRSGQANQLELNDATFALNRARTSYTQASHDFWVSVAALERAAGITAEETR
jgi:outer membrane protein TolC